MRYPLTRMLGSEANVRILRELARHGGELAAASLVARTGLAQSSVREALIGLRSMRIAESVGSGRAQVFRLAARHPLASVVAQLFEAEEERFDAVLASVRTAVSQCRGVVSAWIYGSVARGADRPDSDIDVAVVTEYGRVAEAEEAIREALQAAEESLGFRASTVVIDTRDVLRLSKERDPWWMRTIPGSIPIVGDRPELLVAWLGQRSERSRRRAG